MQNTKILTGSDADRGISNSFYLCSDTYIYQSSTLNVNTCKYNSLYIIHFVCVGFNKDYSLCKEEHNSLQGCKTCCKQEFEMNSYKVIKSLSKYNCNFLTTKFSRTNKNIWFNEPSKLHHWYIFGGSKLIHPQISVLQKRVNKKLTSYMHKDSMMRSKEMNHT